MNKINTYLNKLLKRGNNLILDAWDTVKIEKEETKIAFDILKRMVKSEHVSDNEKKFLKVHSIELIKMVPLVAFQGVPMSIPITTLLVVLGKKYKFDILPKDNRNLLDVDIIEKTSN